MINKLFHFLPGFHQETSEGANCILLDMRESVVNSNSIVLLAKSRLQILTTDLKKDSCDCCFNICNLIMKFQGMVVEDDVPVGLTKCGLKWCGQIGHEVLYNDSIAFNAWYDKGYTREGDKGIGSESSFPEQEQAHCQICLKEENHIEHGISIPGFFNIRSSLITSKIRVSACNSNHNHWFVYIE